MINWLNLGVCDQTASVEAVGQASMLGRRLSRVGLECEPEDRPAGAPQKQILLYVLPDLLCF